MNQRARRAASVLVAILATLMVVGVASAHPLGNATVSRAVAVEVGAAGIGVTAVVDMAEIPAFAAIQAIDLDGDGATDARERAAWAIAACEQRRAGLVVHWDARALLLRTSAPAALTFPAGVGGLETLRLVCSFHAGIETAADGPHRIEVGDTAEDRRPGWREVTIRAGGGANIIEADVPELSPSGALTAYPADRLDAPLDVRSGSALVEVTPAAAEQTAPDGRPASTPPVASDPLVALLAGSARGGGAFGVLIALALSLSIGVGHALSPGHGKALVAASLIGSRGTSRQAIWLAFSVGASHTGGVLLLGGFVLGAGTWLAPDVLLAWLSLAAGACVIWVGGTMLAAAMRRGSGRAMPAPDHPHPHPHSHPHRRDGLETRSLVALGLFGGLVPSTSALIVFLLAVTTGQILLGLGLILAFGAGMSVALAAIALGSVIVGRRVTRGRFVARPALARLVAAVPAVSGLVVLIAGAAMTLGALGRVL